MTPDVTPGVTVHPDIVITPSGVVGGYWRELWRYRGLFYMLAWREVAVRYKQTVAGASWALVQPFVTMVVMSIVFGRVADLPSEGAVPYPLMVFAGVLPWQFFANGVMLSSQGVVANANLIAKVYFPRLIVAASPLLVALVDMLVASVILLGMMAWYEFWPTWRVIVLPLFGLLAVVAALGPALVIGALTVRYRDFRFIVPFALQIGLYVSPVAFSSTVVRSRLGDGLYLLYALNPMVGVIDGCRWALFGGESSPHWPGVALSVVLAALVFGFGLSYFRRAERQFADFV
jgi:lipopolysaccharide transport system permease protein